MSTSINTKVLSRISTTALLGILSMICLTVVGDAAGEISELTQTDSGSRSTRGLWTVLFGAGATLVVFLVCASPWAHCLVHSTGENHDKHDILRFSVLLFKIVLAPQLCVPWGLTAGYAAVLLCHRIKPGISKRLCPMVVWIGIDEDTYGSFFGQQDSTPVESSMDTRPVVNNNEGQGSPASVENNDTGPVIRKLLITDHEKTTVQEFFEDGLQLRKAPNLKVAVPWPVAESKLQLNAGDHPYYFCLQGWDRKTIMWKEAMVKKGALGMEQNISKWLGMVKAMPWWGRALQVVLGLGYEASVLSRFAHHLRVSPLEVMCSWIWLVVVVQAGILPLFVVPSYRGIHLCLDRGQFHGVIQEYIKLRVEHAPPALTHRELWSFVLCILSTFILFLILNPALIYYYYKLPATIFSFVSLSLFALLAGAGIVVFALMLFSTPHQTALNFILCFSRSPSSPGMLVLALLLLLSGLAAYVLAVTDTIMHWRLFEIQDHSFYSSMIPHIGS